MAYIGSSPTKVVSRQSANIFTYTATANQTAFTGADANGNTLACSPSDIMVHMNGLRLEESDYTATTTTVTLGSGAAAGDEVTITAFLTFESADHYTKSAADTRYVNASGDTMTGELVNNSIYLTNDLGQKLFMYRDNNVKYGLELQASDFRVFAEDQAAINLGHTARSDGSTFTSRLGIDSSGRVTKPYQPSFRAGATGGLSGSGTTVIWGTAFHNVGNHLNTTTGVFTAPVAGVYLFAWQGIAASSTQSNEQNITLYKNNVSVNDSRFRGYTENSGHIITVLEMAVNDYVDIRVTNSSTALYNNTFHNQFMGYLLG